MAQQQQRRPEDADKQRVLEESAQAKEQLVREQAERHERARPTPTQAELDAAALGIVVDEKEDDGGEDEAEVLQRQMQARVGQPMGYQTRSADAGKPAPKAPPPPPPQPRREEGKGG
jgi:hypothetical protein